MIHATTPGRRESIFDEEKLADAKRRFAEAERERERLYAAMERLEARRRKPKGQWLKRFLAKL